MKVMFVASNPADGEDLLLEREITELQRRSAAMGSERVEFVFFPRLPLEEFPLEVLKQCPDVLHISAHGDKNGLEFTNSSGGTVRLRARALRNFLTMEKPPRIVYLNACESKAIAEELANEIQIAIGTTAKITNRAARSAALLFYDHLIGGASVRRAFEAGKSMIESLADEGTSSEIYAKEGVSIDTETLHSVPKIVARFFKDKWRPPRDGFYEFEVGVTGCPRNSVQVVIFTDDKSFIVPEDDDDVEDEQFLAGELCKVVRGVASRGTIWAESTWLSYGDFRLFASGVTAGGEQFVASSTLCDALKLQAELGVRARFRSPPPDDWVRAVEGLRLFDGSNGLMPKASFAAVVPKPKTTVFAKKKTAAVPKKKTAIVTKRKVPDVTRKKATKKVPRRKKK